MSSGFKFRHLSLSSFGFEWTASKGGDVFMKYCNAGIRLRRDSWNTTIVTQNVQKVRSWRY
jgi:hypothetical protein